MTTIDLNCDLGELPEAITDGTQEALMRSITSVNVACGGHAGDDETMRVTIEQALRYGVAVGAHPGYPDRENFGRTALQMPGSEVSDFVFAQVQRLADVAARLGAPVRHVKPHGALYNQAVHDGDLAMAIAQGVARWDRRVVLVGLAGSPMLGVFQDAGFAVAAEAFADRRYEPDGTLRARRHRDALLHDPRDAAQQAVNIVREGFVISSNGSRIPMSGQTICIHGDTPGAAEIAASVARALRENGVVVAPLGGGGV